MKIEITRNDDGSVSVPVPVHPIGTEQVGRVILSDDLFKSTGRDLYNDGMVFAIMSQLIVVRCEYLFTSQAFEYYAYSPHFRKNEPGCIPPLYQVHVHVVDGEKASFEFVETTPVNLADVKI